MVKAPSRGLRAHHDYPVALNNMNSVPLKCEHGISLVVGQIIRVDDWQPTVAQMRYRILTMAYTYGFTIASGREERELLMYHWDRQQPEPAFTLGGHLHIGSGLLANPPPIRPGDFHKAHIPTGYIPFSAVVYFAIAELGVTPLTQDWQSSLANLEREFRQPWPITS